MDPFSQLYLKRSFFLHNATLDALRSALLGSYGHYTFFLCLPMCPIMFPAKCSSGDAWLTYNEGLAVFRKSISFDERKMEQFTFPSLNKSLNIFVLLSPLPIHCGSTRGSNISGWNMELLCLSTLPTTNTSWVVLKIAQAQIIGCTYIYTDDSFVVCFCVKSYRDREQRTQCEAHKFNGQPWNEVKVTEH